MTYLHLRSRPGSHERLGNLLSHMDETGSSIDLPEAQLKMAMPEQEEKYTYCCNGSPCCICDPSPDMITEQSCVFMLNCCSSVVR
ncbi:hypothetical protein AAHA92_13847 [Salvia divinorum]|uniref:Uncharacterized protein n=1 Tax=Salvia divinorum TaxID=28513 RepID=A0ABD1HDF7_SALDI